MARPALARHEGHRAGHARHGVLAARPAADHRPQPGHQAAQPRARLHAGPVGDGGLPAAQVLRLGRLAGRPADGRAAALARDDAPRAGQQLTRLQAWAASTPTPIAEMRAILRERGTVSNRDFEMATRTRTQNYRGRKDSALALYYLWRIGEVMTHHRENFERVYALTETVAPAAAGARERRGRGRPVPDQEGSRLLRPDAPGPRAGLFIGAACRAPRPAGGAGKLARGRVDRGAGGRAGSSRATRSAGDARC